MKYRHLYLLLAVLLLPSLAFAKARFMPKEEMIESSDAIVIGTIQKVEELKPAAQGFYRQKAIVTVSQTLMGTPVKSLELFGGEMFICAQCNLKPGTYLMFLKKHRNLWTGTNWDISLRPVKDGKIQWYGKKDERPIWPRTYLSKDDVLAEISTMLKERELIQFQLATIDKQLATKQKRKHLEAIETLRRLHRDGEVSPLTVYREITPRLVRALDDSDAEVQANAICGLAAIGAVYGSGSIGGEKTIETIRTRAFSENPQVSYYAVLALARCGDTRFRKDDALLKHLSSTVTESKDSSGVMALGLLKRPEGIAPLLERLDNLVLTLDAGPIRLADGLGRAFPMLQALTSIGTTKSSRPLLERMMKPAYARYAGPVADALRRIADPTLKKDLIHGLKSKNKAARLGCITALGVKGWDGAVKPLLAILEDPSETQAIRWAAAISIAYIGTGESVVILQRGLLPKTDKQYLPTSGVYGSVELLGRTKNSAALPILVKLLKAKRTETVISAANALRHLGDHRAARPLLAALKRKDATVNSDLVANAAYVSIQNAVHFAMMSLFPNEKDARNHLSGKGYDWNRVVAEQEYRMEQIIGILPVSFEVKRPKQITWGPCAENGLQMGAWFDADRNLLFAVIRNVGDKPVQYSDYLLGYAERGDMGIALWGRKGKTSQWTRLPFRSKARMWVKSAGAGKQNIHTIQPKAWMVPAAISSGKLPQIRFSAIPKPPITDTTGYTFCISLDLFDMPTAIGSAPEIQIRQPFGNDGSTDTWAGTLTCDIPIKRPG